MASLTPTAANSVLDLMFGSGRATSFPATYYLALFTTATVPTSSGGTEPSGNAYARVAVTNNDTNFPAASGGTKANATSVIWPTASGSWGTVGYVGLYNAASGGTFYGYATLSSNVTVSGGMTVALLANGLSISITTV